MPMKVKIPKNAAVLIAKSHESDCNPSLHLLTNLIQKIHAHVLVTLFSIASSVRWCWWVHCPGAINVGRALSAVTFASTSVPFKRLKKSCHYDLPGVLEDAVQYSVKNTRLIICCFIRSKNGIEAPLNGNANKMAGNYQAVRRREWMNSPESELRFSMAKDKQSRRVYLSISRCLSNCIFIYVYQ